MANKISKQEKVLTHLQTYGSITPLEALEKYGTEGSSSGKNLPFSSLSEDLKKKEEKKEK